MYGLVNSAVKDYICKQFGQEAWRLVRCEVGPDADFFLSMEPYPDALTYLIVGTAADVTGASVAQLLEGIGEYWVDYTAQQGYKDLLTVAGRTFPEFLSSIDSLHSHIRMSYPKLRPPSFQCEEIEAGLLRFRYYSQREGLAPMVVGLLRGVGHRFDVTLRIEHTVARHDGAEHDEFLVHYAPRSTGQS